MKRLNVPLLVQIAEGSSMEEVSEALDRLEKHAIATAPWPDFDYVPKVEFSIAHNRKAICLKYYVEEAVIKASYYKTDDPVFRDSCVEFFIAFNREDAYYNLEVNVIGTCKLNFGKNRYDRIVVAEQLIKKIRYLSVIKNGNKAIQWQITLYVPADVFSMHEIDDFSGQIGGANFYKCGDDLPTPHFLCWNDIDTPEPDFHVRRCFGEVLFL
jgi:hypothetical protein